MNPLWVHRTRQKPHSQTLRWGLLSFELFMRQLRHNALKLPRCSIVSLRESVKHTIIISLKGPLCNWIVHWGIILYLSEVLTKVLTVISFALSLDHCSPGSALDLILDLKPFVNFGTSYHQENQSFQNCQVLASFYLKSLLQFNPFLFYIAIGSKKKTDSTFNTAWKSPY